MNRKNFLLLTFVVVFTLSYRTGQSQVPQGFNYQAIARDGSGNQITNTTLQVKLSVLADTSASPVVLWEELHNPVRTNAFGLFSVVLGTGVKQTGSAATFSAINWNTTQLFIKTQIYYQSSWKNMGFAKLWSVPYSMSSGGVTGAVPKLAITGSTTDFNEALFEVKNNLGQTVFAVYNEGVRAYVDNGAAKGGKGGFAIGSFGTAKAASQNLMMISNDSARIYVNETAVKGTKGGFAIGGFNPAKGTVNEFMHLNPDNYFVGYSSGKSITTGKFNSTFGYQGGMNLTTGMNNVFVGYQSGISTTFGSSNVFIGNQAGYSNTTGNYNIILGRAAGYDLSTGWGNIVLGDYAATNLTSGLQNVIIGDLSGITNTIGSSNIFLGANSGYSNTTGSYNNIMGANSGYLNTTGSYNSFIGYMAGYNNTTGQYNTYLGYLAGYSGIAASGSNNIFMGVESGYSNTTGFDNIAIGNKAGRSNLDGNYNILIGSSAGNLNVSGDYNTFMGYKAGEKNTSDWNTMLGYLAGNANTSGGSQVLLGYLAGSTNTGGWNTMVGSLAGSSSLTGAFNTYLGLAAGEQATGSNNVFLGRWAGRFETTNSNKLIIESKYDGTDYLNNALIYGDFSDKLFRLNGREVATTNKAADWAGIFINNGGASDRYGVKVQAGTADGTGTNYMMDFHSSSGAWKGSITLTNGTLAIYNVSDARQKQDVVASGIDALKMLNDLPVVDFAYTKSPAAKHTGYIAQDAQKVMPEMVIYNEKEDTYATSTTQLIPVLHKAILEQQKLIEAQSRKIAELEAAVNRLSGK
jgi:hypothetical protein